MARQHLTTLLMALLIEAAFGYPAWLQRLVGHPVQGFGWVIGGLDRRLNREGAAPGWRRAMGVFAVLVLLGVAAGLALAVARLCGALPGGWGLLAQAVVASAFFAQRSLYSYVGAVGAALRQSGLAAGQMAVAHIVGRNPAALDQPAVLRAAVESLAENFSDAVVAPAFWCAMLGLPGLFIYKAVNTADSMIGHRTPRHEAFGWAAARLDDGLNLPASRLSALLLAAAALRGGQAAAALASVRRDARRHRSPNAGWPEAAMAGALGIRLNGPRRYGEQLMDDAWMGQGPVGATLDDLARSLALYRAACVALVALVAAIALAI